MAPISAPDPTAVRAPGFFPTVWLPSAPRAAEAPVRPVKGISAPPAGAVMRAVARVTEEVPRHPAPASTVVEERRPAVVTEERAASDAATVWVRATGGDEPTGGGVRSLAAPAGAPDFLR